METSRSLVDSAYSSGLGTAPQSDEREIRSLSPASGQFANALLTHRCEKRDRPGQTLKRRLETIPKTGKLIVRYTIMGIQLRHRRRLTRLIVMFI